jgi:hypothetical protein
LKIGQDFLTVSTLPSPELCFDKNGVFAGDVSRRGKSLLK